MFELQKKITRILCPRFDTLGDIVLFEGFIEALKVSQPDLEITILLRSGCAQLSELFPPELNLNWEHVDLEAYGEITPEHIAVFEAFLDQIEGQSDLIIFSAFNPTWLDYKLAERFSDISQTAIGDVDTFQRWPTAQATLIPVDKNSHEIDKYAELLRQVFGINDVLPFPRLVVPTEYKQKATAVLGELGITDRNYGVIFPAGTRNQSIKAWPLDRFAEIVSWIVEEKHFVPLLLGHVSERETVRALAGMLSAQGVNSAQWLGHDGELPLFAAVLEKSRIYVGNDTGPMHIAAALGVPTVGIFGGGHGFRFLPAGQHSIGIIGNMPCFDCGWDCIFGDAPCKLMIDVYAVKEAINLVLSGQPMSDNLLSVEKNLPVIIPEIIRKAKSERVKLLELIDAANNERDRLCKNDKHESNKVESNYEEELHTAQLIITAMQTSVCWRITGPLRNLIDWIVKWQK